MTQLRADHDLVVAIDAVQPCWLSDCEGDPGRTCDPRSAQRFASRGAAEKALSTAQGLYPARTYSINTLPALQS